MTTKDEATLIRGYMLAHVHTQSLSNDLCNYLVHHIAQAYWLELLKMRGVVHIWGQHNECLIYLFHLHGAPECFLHQTTHNRAHDIPFGMVKNGVQPIGIRVL